MCISESNIYLIIQIRSLFGITVQASVDEAVDVFEDVNLDETNFYSFAIVERVHNEAVAVVDDTDYLVDNPQ